MINAGVPTCCQRSCGRLIPLVVNGTYNDPTGEGKTFITFNLATSQCCGIPVTRVLRGDLDGLIGRDNLARLNPSSGSMRLHIVWPGYKRFVRKVRTKTEKPWMITPNDKFTIEGLVRKVCAQLKAFIVSVHSPSRVLGSDLEKDQVQVGDGSAPEWAVGRDGISVEHLVLVALKRTSAGAWIPYIRLTNDQDGV
ncbi:hypothetical protein BDM02DRAFT_3185040 [Thelephora ganbajun]|uniref:Uncharacterized protein n=1 Tax=Thelephora ganbajun TaxID=370292 RepID=A0ACB6ZM36_THEGA|nr:hypothetical protein BDM02DRAFT_3185040 [Thelephora ganbajun]